MALTAAQQTRVEYIVQKGISLEMTIAKLNTYIKDSKCDPINAQLRLKGISTRFIEYERYNDELTRLNPAHPRLEAFLDIESDYYEIATVVTKLQTSTPLASSTLNHSNITISEKQDRPKLPEIKIPAFDGEHSKWVSWKHSFEALVHSRSDLSDYIKHTQLANALSGSASNKIIAFPPSEENYSKAWKSLCEAYDQKRIIVAEHLDAILDLSVLSKANPDDLSSLMDKARQHISMLKEVDIEIHEQIVIRIIERCLPPGILSKWQDRLDGNQLPNLEELYKFLQSTVFKLRSLERVASSGRNISRKRGGEQLNQPFPKVRKVEARALVTSASDFASTPCIKCKEQHYLFKCPIFNELQVRERWNLVKTHKLCRNCLYEHAFPCKSKKRCKKCDREHHTLLHSEKSPKSIKQDPSQIPKIADPVPNETFPRNLFDIPKNLPLADPQFHIPKPVDLLIAAGTTLSVLSVGQVKLRHHRAQIILQKTTLGWIVAGGSDSIIASAGASCNVVKLDKLLERFWSIEDFDHEPLKSRDDVACEQHYVDHTQRDANGRYIVRLPFRDSKFKLGESRGQASKRFYSLERKFESNPQLKSEYHKVMEEYVSLNHMTLCDETKEGCYLPHHAVIKTSSETTKVRVVFDASAKTSTGISLNEVLLTGSTIQNTIFEQTLRFRTHTYVITADIEKMYRQVLVHPDDRMFQKILWYHQGKIRTFQLNTVTFGIACAPFLAIRTLHQLALDEGKDFPRASKILLRDFYVDDLVSGANSIEEILSIRDEMIELLARGGFVIRQWSSNHTSALNNIDKKIFNLDCGIKENPIQKTLGIIWDSQRDILTYTVRSIDTQKSSTKRKVLSEISKIFDPLGLLGPVILYAKVLIQDCWKAKVTWDESLPQDIQTKWKSLTAQLPVLQDISMPRNLLRANPEEIEIHGFCDASFQGYGACLFVRSLDAKGIVTTNLVCSKSRVAPLSGVTIPRLELCAATILKKLYVESRAQLAFPIKRVIFWSDSTIVLCWLKKAPHLLRTFESNRVAEIQTLGDQVQWRHVRSEDNPADSLSRGQLPADFVKNSLWISGPSWLARPEKEWPRLVEFPSVEIPGVKTGTCLLLAGTCDYIYSRVSSFKRLTRLVAYFLRWKNLKSHRNRPLSCREISDAERRLVAMIQRERFPEEIKRLATVQEATPGETTVSYRKSTKFDELNPFLDEYELIRVGGRLKKADLIYNQKHPLLIPSKHPITDLIIRECHEDNKHSGIQSTVYSLREKFWILNGKNQVRKIVHRCVECIRQRPRLMQAQMAGLPEARVTEAPAFSRTGVDFFGPILIKEKKFRNRVFVKTYGCVFICMVSKAVHIELATDLSTEGFLAALRRFIGRRGVPEHIHSDNGTNFVGADKELREIYALFDTAEFKQAIGGFALSKRIEWHFNPPLSPHFGGLWEAAVKSFKHHLKRVLKDQKLTYEQLCTLLIEIEAILNSRPLCALSADPNDPSAITPAHLLIGRPFNFLPAENLVSVSDNRLSTYHFITKARQDFWKKWHKEYLNELQTRQKWHKSTSELKVGSVVILREDNMGCARWPLGVIMEVYPESDDIARVATVKTASGVYKRNITRLCLLPVA